MEVSKDNVTRRSTPIPVFMSGEYRKLVERLSADAERLGLHETQPRVTDFSQIVKDLEYLYMYSIELSMYSGSEALKLIEETLAEFIRY